MQSKENYYIEFLKEYHEIKKEYKEVIPKLLLHVCCGACSCYPLVFLSGLFDITIFYSNSNIYPEEEFDKRYAALSKYVDYINKKLKSNIKLVLDPYNHEEYLPILSPYKDMKEGGTRCELCIKKRMKRVFEYAKENDFKFVTTVMTVSRNKNVNYINKLGKELENEFSELTHIFGDFKKNNGQDIGVMISKECDVYRQNYCGCEFSIHELNDKKR